MRKKLYLQLIHSSITLHDHEIHFTPTIATYLDPPLIRKAYPIPTAGSLYLDMGIVFPSLEASILDGQGRMVYYERFHHISRIKPELPGPPGLYQILLTTPNGSEFLKVFKH